MSFHLTSSDDSFNSRVNNLFDSLDAVNTDLSLNSKNDLDQSGSFRSNKRKFDDSQHCEKDHVFLKPSPRRHYKSTPDYLKNPKKWTCYSMEDTKCASDSENRKIGIDLMKDLKSNDIKDSEISEKIAFKKPISVIMSEEDEQRMDTSSVIRSDTKFVLPEYEFGKGSKSKNKKRLDKSKMAKDEKTICKEKVILSHLDFNDDEDE